MYEWTCWDIPTYPKAAVGYLRISQTFGGNPGQLCGRGNIVPQLMFNVDVSSTLQLVYMKLVESESPETISFLDSSSKLTPRSNIHDTDWGTYMIDRPVSDQITNHRRKHRPRNAGSNTLFFKAVPKQSDLPCSKLFSQWAAWKTGQHRVCFQSRDR